MDSPPAEVKKFSPLTKNQNRECPFQSSDPVSAFISALMDLFLFFYWGNTFFSSLLFWGVIRIKLHSFWFHSSSTLFFQSPSPLQLPNPQHLPLATPFLQWWAAVWYPTLPLPPLAWLNWPTVSMEHQRDLTLHLWKIHLRGTKIQRC